MKKLKMAVMLGLMFKALLGISDDFYSERVEFVNKKLKEAQTIGNNPNLPLVVVITTGGTIAEKKDPETGDSIPAISGNELVNAIPDLLKRANIKVVNLANEDSSRLTPKLWYKLSIAVNKIIKDQAVTGVVVTHGTDTMAQGSYFIDLTVNTEKPVVFTGAMRDASSLSPDGPSNLMNSVIQASSPNARNWGVTVTMNQYINSARDVRKINTSNLQAFNSGEKGYLGYVAQGEVFRLNDATGRQFIPLPQKKLPKVEIIMDYAGAGGEILKNAVDGGAEGIVIQAVGAGNVNKEIYESVKYALKKNIPVIITTEVYYGRVYPVYGGPGGGASLEESGAVGAGDLTTRKARILLMLALSHTKDIKKIRKFFK